MPATAQCQARGRRWYLALGSLGLLALGSLALVAWPATLHVPGVLLGGDAYSIEPALAGVVEEVLLPPGAEVAEGQLLVRLEAAQTSSELALRERELDALRRATSRARHADTAALAEWVTAAEGQRSALVRQRDLALEQREQRARALVRYRDAVAEGLVRPGDEQAARDACATADSGVAALDEQLAALAVSLAERRHDGQQRERERTQAVRRALAAVEHARATYALAEVRSPIAGRIASVLVVRGARVQPGVPLVRVVPTGAAPAVVAFVPTREAHRVFVGMDADVAVNADATHAAGASPARVTRVPGGEETLLELAAFAAGAAEAFAPVELALLDEANPDLAAAIARSGEQPIRVHLHADHHWRASLAGWWQG